MITILGAGGAVGRELVKEYAATGQRVRLVGRSPKPAGDHTEFVAADLSDTDQTAKAVEGSKIAFLLAGLKYDIAVWREFWPRIMANAIEACKRSGARLVFFDNVYMYGKVDGFMTEETPFRPCTKKGEIRARIAGHLLNEISGGRITAMIARAADFYGPGVEKSGPGILIFNKLAKHQTPTWIGSDTVKHSFTFTPDTGRALITLAESDAAWNQTWHLPTAPDPPTGREFIELAAREYGRPPKYRTLGKPMMRLAGLFDSDVREMVELMYQNDYDYLFDSTKFTRAFGDQATPYAEGIPRCART
jgi:nucleoside-diphosphate-sugar epimerase